LAWAGKSTRLQVAPLSSFLPHHLESESVFGAIETGCALQQKNETMRAFANMKASAEVLPRFRSIDFDGLCSLGNGSAPVLSFDLLVRLFKTPDECSKKDGVFPVGIDVAKTL
jgi:hypothetical protein